jgi:hypothetical protein
MNEKEQETKQPRSKHGIYFWLKSGRINPSVRGHKKLQRYLEDVEADLINCLGGPEKVSAGQEILIKGTIEAYGVILLASMYCKKEGILRPDMFEKGVIELQPVLGKQLLSFLNTVRLNLISLNLNQGKVEEVLDLQRYLKENYGGDKDDGEKTD